MCAFAQLAAQAAVASAEPPAKTTGATDTTATPEAGDGEPAKLRAAEPLGISLSLTGSYQYQSTDDRTLMMVANVSYTRPSGLSLFGRLGWVDDAAADAAAVSDLLLGVTKPIGLSANFGLTLRFVGILPIGMGGGDDAKPSVLQAQLSATDWGGPMFAPDHATLGPGVRLSFQHGSLFAFADTSLYYAFRVRGAAIDPIGSTIAFQASKLIVGAAFSAFDAYGGVAETLYWGNPAVVMASPASRADNYAVVGFDWSHRFGTNQVHVGVLYGLAVDTPKVQRNFQIGEVSSAIDF